MNPMLVFSGEFRELRGSWSIFGFELQKCKPPSSYVRTFPPAKFFTDWKSLRNLWSSDLGELCLMGVVGGFSTPKIRQGPGGLFHILPYIKVQSEVKVSLNILWFWHYFLSQLLLIYLLWIS